MSCYHFSCNANNKEDHCQFRLCSADGEYVCYVQWSSATSHQAKCPKVPNRRGQSGLWGYAISGDLSIVLLQIEDPANFDLVRQLVQAGVYWRVLKVQSESGRSRRLSATGYVEWGLGDLRPKSTRITWFMFRRLSFFLHRLFGLLVLRTLLLDHLVGQVVFVDIADVLDRLTADLFRGDDFDIAESDIGVKPPPGGELAQLRDPTRPRIVGGKNEKPFIEGVHGLIGEVLIHHEADVFHSRVNIGLNLADVTNAQPLSRRRQELLRSSHSKWHSSTAFGHPSNPRAISRIAAGDCSPFLKPGR